MHHIGSDGSSSEPVSGCDNKPESVISLQIKLDSSLRPEYAFDPTDVLVTIKLRCISQKQVIEILAKTVADPGFSAKTKARNVNLFFGNFRENGMKSKKNWLGGGGGGRALLPPPWIRKS